MLVHRESRKLVLNLQNPERVTDVIPGAKTLPHNGSSLVVVPHREDEVRVLRNLKFDAPAPIEHYYDWPCRYANGPMKHQVATAAFLTVNPKAYCLNDLGSGKTLSGLWAFDYLAQAGKAKRMLVVSPLSTLERTWADEIFTHFPHLTAAVLHGSMERRLKLLAVPHDIYIVNHDGIKSAPLLDALCARDDIDVVLIDELAVCRTSGTERYKAAGRLVQGRKFVWGFTGTPTPNAPTDAWAQCRLITPHSVPKYFGKFRDEVMKQVSPFKWLPRANALDVVRAAMQPSIRFSREECIDLPPTTYSTREVTLTKEQKKAFDDMMRTLRAEYAGGQVLAVNEAVKLGKLIQTVTGALYDNSGGVIELPAGPRIDVVKEIIEEASAKVLVFVPYTGALEMVARELREHFSVEVVQGATPKSERDRIFSEFQKRVDPQVLVANPGTLSHGLTLTAGNTIVWYAPITSAEIYTQACARIVRPGQRLNTHIINIESTPIERVMYDRLRKRENMQNTLLDLLKGVK